MANEKRLIDANAFIAQYCSDCGWRCDLDNKCCATVDEFMNAPTVDAVEVVHGRWEWLGPYRYNGDGVIGTCSVCKERLRLFARNYCPNCGAKMDGGNEDG